MSWKMCIEITPRRLSHTERPVKDRVEALQISKRVLILSFIKREGCRPAGSGSSSNLVLVVRFSGSSVQLKSRRNGL